MNIIATVLIAAAAITPGDAGFQNTADHAGATAIADGSDVQAGTRATDTPEARYKRQVGCAAILQASVERLQEAAFQAKVGEAIHLARQAAERSGAAIGKAADAVQQDIAADQTGIKMRFDAAAGSPDGVKKQEADLGKTAIACALIHAIEETTHQ